MKRVTHDDIGCQWQSQNLNQGRCSAALHWGYDNSSAEWQLLTHKTRKSTMLSSWAKASRARNKINLFLRETETVAVREIRVEEVRHPLTSLGWSALRGKS